LKGVSSSKGKFAAQSTFGNKVPTKERFKKIYKIMNITLEKVGGAPTGENIIKSCGLAICGVEQEPR